MKIPKMPHIIFLAGLTGLAAALSAPCAVADDLPNVIHFELGETDFTSGDSITIQQMHGTSDIIKVGETYSVDGVYDLASHDEADLAFYATSIGPSGPTPVDALQHIRIKKGHGTFHLVKTMGEDGYLHVSFYPVPSGSGFGGIYFGQGNRVLRSWASSNVNAASGPNQVLLNYLGDPVTPPTDLDARYTKEGLNQAIETAARNAGITVKQMTIDDSEFPCLIGVVCAGSDSAKLKEQLRKMDGYEYSGSIGNDTNSDGSDTCNAFSLVPHRAYPPEARQQIYHRLWLRQQVFYDRINLQK